MAQSNFEERIDTYEIESTNVMTGDRDRSRYLYYQLKMSMAKAKQIDIIVSFLMESGVRMLLNDMKRALDRGVKIRILTGNYLGITQPSALYLIKSELGDRVDLRLYNETSRSFHPKSYIFHYESSNEIYIGSSNISKSALTSGIEWNYRFSDTLDKKNYELFYATFEDLFLNHSIIIDDEELQKKVGFNKYDVVVANILADVIIPISAIVDKFLKKGGIFISSGIIYMKEEDVVDAIKKNHKLKFMETVNQGDWRAIMAQKISD